jgi:adenine-specific DNA-methyltransferase
VVFLEEVIDACVMEVYFSDHMAEHRLGIMAHVTPLLQDFDAAAPPAQQVATAQQFYAQANDSKHPIRNILIRIPVDSPDLLAVIQREGAV